MINPILKQLAIPFDLYDGQMTMYVLPYGTLLVNKVIGGFDAFLPTEQRDSFDWALIKLESFVVDIEFHGKKLAPKVRGWQVYWQAAQDCPDYPDKHQLFREIAGIHFVADVNLAFNQTRDASLDAPGDLQTPAEDAAPQS